MADADLSWGGDFSLTPDGDLALVEGDTETEQSIIRRLFTVAGAYIWAPEYGAGIPERVGRVARERTIAAIVRSQIALEATVARQPVPKIKVSAASDNPGLFVIRVDYTSAVTGAAVAVTFEVPGAR